MIFSPLIWQYVVSVKSTVKISLIFVAFLEITKSNIPYSREQKHVVSISDTPILLIEINSISNMGCQK